MAFRYQLASELYLGAVAYFNLTRTPTATCQEMQINFTKGVGQSTKLRGLLGICLRLDS